MTTTTSPITLDEAVEMLSSPLAQVRWDSDADAYVDGELPVEPDEKDGVRFVGPYLAADGRVSVDVFDDSSDGFTNVELGRVDGLLDRVARVRSEAGHARLVADDADHTDLGPATAEHIAAQLTADRKGETAFAVDPDTLRVLHPGEFGYADALTVWVD